VVQLSARPRIGKVSAALGVGAGLLAVALGVGLVQEADTGFGRAWAASFVVFGVVSLLGVVAAIRPPERGSPWARPLALAVLLLLAGWAVVTAVVGVVEESWLWGVLLGVPAAYLLWAAARVWRSDPDDAAARRP
jgi:peptidoglycan/LPS O-acetylase OafA/YrhL